MGKTFVKTLRKKQELEDNEDGVINKCMMKDMYVQKKTWAITKESANEEIYVIKIKRNDDHKNQGKWKKTTWWRYNNYY